nr:hypothetical protein [Micromonospora sp. DSM 115978]
MNSAEWISLYRNRTAWCREFGPKASPVRLVAAAEETRQVADLIDQLTRDERLHLVVGGGTGTGKSAVVTAAYEALRESGTPCQLLTSPEMLRNLLRLIGGRQNVDQVVLIDDDGSWPDSSLGELLKVRGHLRGLLATARTINAGLEEQLC